MRYAACARKCHSDRFKSVSETGEIRRGGSAGAYHGLCQFGGFHGYRVSEGGAGLRDRLQDLYDRRAGDFVWDLYQLGAGGDLLDREDVRNCLKRNKKVYMELA